MHRTIGMCRRHSAQRGPDHAYEQPADPFVSTAMSAVFHLQGWSYFVPLYSKFLLSSHLWMQRCSLKLHIIYSHRIPPGDQWIRILALSCQRQVRNGYSSVPEWLLVIPSIHHCNDLTGYNFRERIWRWVYSGTQSVGSGLLWWKQNAVSPSFRTSNFSVRLYPSSWGIHVGTYDH